MKVLVLGSGGREHALCWAISKSSLCEKLYCIPGSDSIKELADCFNIDPMNNIEIVNFCIGQIENNKEYQKHGCSTNGLNVTLRYRETWTYKPIF